MAAVIFPGCSVRVTGLQSDSGKQLNGRVGVAGEFDEESGRWFVRFSPNRSANVKPCNLSYVSSAPASAQQAAEDPAEDSQLSFERGDAVECVGLQSEAGKELNGKNGIVTGYIPESGRFEVRFALGPPKYDHRLTTMKPENLRKIAKVPSSAKPRSKPTTPAQAQQRPKDIFNRTSVNEPSSDARAEQATAPFAEGDHVEVSGLTSESGRQLNGQRGVVAAWNAETGRADVRFSEEKLLSLKPACLTKVSAGSAGYASSAGNDIPFVIGDRVEVFGLTSDSGRPLNGQIGEISQFNEDKGRYDVTFGAKLMSLKAANLRLSADNLDPKNGRTGGYL